MSPPKNVSTKPEEFVFTRLYSLTITICESAEGRWNIDAGSFPVLKVLSITFLGPRTHFELPDFASLTEITIKTRLPTFTQGMQFHRSLLCEPRKCPRLEQICLDSLLEWDIVYLSLRRRNINHDAGVSRIKRMRVPRIPAKFCHIFASVLAGRDVLPSPFLLNLPHLSIQEAQSRLLDAERSGIIYPSLTSADELTGKAASAAFSLGLRIVVNPWVHRSYPRSFLHLIAQTAPSAK